MGINITTNNVFDFMASNEETRKLYLNEMNRLITRTTAMIESYIGRKLTKKAFNIKIHNGRYCTISGKYLFLHDIYFDTYEITSLTEDDVTLTEDTDFVMTRPNILERIDSNWSQFDQLNIQIIGNTGLVDTSNLDSDSDCNTLEPLRQIVIETCAIMSGLWGRVVDDGEGNTFQITRNSLPKESRIMLDSWKLPIAC